MDTSAKTLLGIECLALSKDREEDPDTEDSPWPAASHLQVTMVRGLAWHWKQLVAYEFTGIVNFIDL